MVSTHLLSCNSNGRSKLALRHDLTTRGIHERYTTSGARLRKLLFILCSSPLSRGGKEASVISRFDSPSRPMPCPLQVDKQSVDQSKSCRSFIHIKTEIKGQSALDPLTRLDASGFHRYSATGGGSQLAWHPDIPYTSLSLPCRATTTTRGRCSNS